MLRTLHMFVGSTYEVKGDMDMLHFLSLQSFKPNFSYLLQSFKTWIELYTSNYSPFHLHRPIAHLILLPISNYLCARLTTICHKDILYFSGAHVFTIHCLGATNALNFHDRMLILKPFL